ncbi:unnamed protein product, partial [Amoebophrya sp. A25]
LVLVSELLNFALVALHAVSLRRRFQCLQLLKLARFVVEKVYLAVCSLPPKHFVDETRYWRLCQLCTKLLRMMLRGPLAQREIFCNSLLGPLAEQQAMQGVGATGTATASGNTSGVPQTGGR